MGALSIPGLSLPFSITACPTKEVNPLGSLIMRNGWLHFSHGYFSLKLSSQLPGPRKSHTEPAGHAVLLWLACLPGTPTVSFLQGSPEALHPGQDHTMFRTYCGSTGPTGLSTPAQDMTANGKNSVGVPQALKAQTKLALKSDSQDSTGKSGIGCLF